MDIAKLSTEDNHWEEPYHCQLFTDGADELDSNGEPVTIDVISEHSKAPRKQVQAQKAQIAKLMRRYGSWEAIPDAEHNALSDAKLAACIVGWSGFESNGAPFPYSPQNALVLVAALRDRRPKHFKQLEGAIDGHDSFFAMLHKP